MRELPPRKNYEYQRGRHEIGRTGVAMLLIGDDKDWTQRANCSPLNAELFFPQKGGSAKEAKRICDECPVKLECLEDALEDEEKHGVWGGMTANERKTLRSKRLRRQRMY